MHSKDTDGMANSVDHDQIVPSEAVIMGLDCLSKNLDHYGIKMF